MKTLCRKNGAAGILPANPLRSPWPAESLPHAPRHSRRPRAFALIEALVYIGLVLLVLGIGTAALYRCIDNSLALRRSADDLARALRVGEAWRAHVRAATTEPRLEAGPDGETLLLPGANGGVAYRFDSGSVYRRIGPGPWVLLMDHLKASTMAIDRRRNVAAWRWELELEPRTKASVKAPHVQPLFTFTAVPARASN